jgi:hypothetical protein
MQMKFDCPKNKEEIMWRSFSRPLLCFSLLLGLCVLPAWGQMGSQGTISVAVVDQSGAVVPDADLTLQDLATNLVRTAATQTAGTYTFVGLSLGNYKLTVSKSGFETQVFDAVTVQAARVTDVKVTLKVGTVTQQVVVSERAVPIIETTSNAISGTIDLKRIEQLPMTGRDITQLAYAVAGYAGARGTGGTWNGLPLVATGSNIDGVQANTNRMKFSGNTAPAVSARLEDIQEMTIQTDMLNLNTGYGTTSMQINFVTRRGSNEYHGRVYLDHRNAALNANSWINNATLPPPPGKDKAYRPRFILNDFGGSVGGPIIKNKLFFFGSFAMDKRPGAATVSNTFLTADAQQGDFTFIDNDGVTQTVNVLTDIAQPNGLPYAVNPVTSTIFQEINGSLSAGGVTPTEDPILNTLTWPNRTPITRKYPAFRVDYNVSENFRINVAFNNTRRNEAHTGYAPFPGSAFANRATSNTFNFYTAALGMDWSISPTLINQFRGGFLYFNQNWDQGAEPLWTTQPSITWPIADSGHWFRTPISTYYPLWNVADNVTWQRGAHTVNFGFSFYREQDHYWNPREPMYVNLGLASNDPALSIFENSPLLANASDYFRGQAEGLYAILVGRISGVNGTFPLDPQTKQYIQKVGGAYNLNELSKAWGLFVQDSYRIKPSLTLNYGLRWDFTGDNHDLTAAYHSADLEGIYGPSGIGNMFKPGTLTGPADPVLRARSHVYEPWNVSPQPAFGIAWNPKYTEGLMGKLFGEGKTVIRTGFSLRRVTPPYQYYWNSASNMGYAFYQNYSLSPSTVPGPGTFPPGSLSLASTEISGLGLPAFRLSPSVYQEVIPQSEETFYGYWGGVNGMLPTIKQPYVMSWNLGIQRALGQSNVLEVRYIGNRSVHQWVTQNINEVNIFENGFLTEFLHAQANLAINEANGIPNSFANSGLPGQFALPIMTTAGLDPADGYFVTLLRRGRAGDFASMLAGGPWGEGAAYLCNLVGSVNFSPCLPFTGGVPVAGAYPINFFQVNPFNAGKGSELMSDVGWGNYHALQLELRQKPWHGMQFDVNYTWSHTMGVQPGNSWTGGFNMFTMRDLRLNYGPTLFDFRHVMHANGTYDLPFGKGKRFANQGGVLDKVVGGWSIGTIVTYMSGAPYMLQSGYNTYNGPANLPISGRYGDSGVNLIGVTQSQIQNSVGVYRTGLPFSDTVGTQYLVSPTTGGANPDYIVPNTTAGVNGYHPWFTGPRRFFQDLAITKSIPITERLRFNFQSQFLNVWNHPVWGSPNANIRSSAFGHSSVMTNFDQGLGERQIEFRANLEF